jgi:NADH-quinone oxidoreductase subunit J
VNVIAFYIAGAIAIASTVLVITSRNAVQALLYLATSLIAVAVVFYDLGAPFIAALEIIIYAGSIIVLFVFVVMMLNLGKRATETERQWQRPRMWIAPAILAAALVAEVVVLLGRGNTTTPMTGSISPRDVGLALYGPYLIGVELSSVLLTAALVGAYHLGWHKRPKPESQDVAGDYTTRTAAGRDPVGAGSGRPAGAA